MADDKLTPVKMGGPANEHEGYLRKVAAFASKALPKKLGFTIFIFDQGKDGLPGYVSYLSTADRTEMCSVIREWLKQASP